MVTLIQRFGSALNLNMDLHMLFLDAVHVTAGRRPRFLPLPPRRPRHCRGCWSFTHRINRHLERRGLLMRYADCAYIAAAMPVVHRSQHKGLSCTSRRTGSAVAGSAADMLAPGSDDVLFMVIHVAHRYTPFDATKARVVALARGRRVLYLKHRRDGLARLATLADRLGFEVLSFDLPMVVREPRTGWPSGPSGPPGGTRCRPCTRTSR